MSRRSNGRPSPSRGARVERRKQQRAWRKHLERARRVQARKPAKPKPSSKPTGDPS